MFKNKDSKDRLGETLGEKIPNEGIQSTMTNTQYKKQEEVTYKIKQEVTQLNQTSWHYYVGMRSSPAAFYGILVACTETCIFIWSALIIGLFRDHRSNFLQQISANDNRWPIIQGTLIKGLKT